MKFEAQRGTKRGVLKATTSEYRSRNEEVRQTRKSCILFVEDFTKKHCVPCEGGTIPLTMRQAEEYLAETPGWELRRGGGKIAREWKFKNFSEAMAFVNSVAALAKREGHHPDIHVSYSRVRLELATHAIGGLSTNDFILAAKINNI